MRMIRFGTTKRFYVLSQERFAEILCEFTERNHLDKRLLEAEKRNLARYGYGIKGFTLSMIETAIEVTDARVPATVIREILDIGKDMLGHPIELLPHAREAVEALAATHHRLILITKGDLLDQERKLAQSGLGDLFDGIEIVSEKGPETYSRIFTEHGDGPERAMMVGQLDEVGHPARPRCRRLGGACALSPGLGAGTCRSAGLAGAVPHAGGPWRVDAIAFGNPLRSCRADGLHPQI